MAARNTFNPKRRLAAGPATPAAKAALDEIAKKVRYVGSAFHKRNPGDFGLEPPAAPRPGKTLCDGVVDCVKDAQGLLEEGAKRGTISEQMRNGWPQNIWAVTKNGIPVEAQLDNETQGIYHGYPMPDADPMREKILDSWK